MKNGPYELVVAPSGYPGKRYRGRYAYEHHVVWWKKYKSLPPKKYIIHHKNGKHRDNRIANLEMLLESDHGRLHSKKPEMASFICGYCKKSRPIQARTLRSRRWSGYKKTYCNRSCMGKDQVWTNLFQGRPVGLGQRAVNTPR